MFKITLFLITNPLITIVIYVKLHRVQSEKLPLSLFTGNIITLCTQF